MSRAIRLRPPRRPNTAIVDVRIGLTWWGGLSQDQRNAWLEQAASPSRCWKAYKSGMRLEGVLP